MFIIRSFIAAGVLLAAGLSPLSAETQPFAWRVAAAGSDNRFLQQTSVTPAYNPANNSVMVDPEDENAGNAALPEHLRRQIVTYPTREPAGTIVVDTPNTYLYYVLGDGRAIRYGIGVGRDGFTWSGVKSIERKTEWPDWYPPADMLARQPYLPRMMAGGPGNPLGARAMYIGGTVYRIHGTNAPHTIGKHVSSGCIRMLNEDVTDLYERAKVGGKVVVLADTASRTAGAQPQARPAPERLSQAAPAPLSLNPSSLR